MVKRSQRSSEPHPRADAEQAPSEPAAATPTSGETRARKPYRRPTVQKRRSLAEATLFSGSGLTGTLVS